MKYTNLFFIKTIYDVLFQLSYWCVFRWMYFKSFQGYALKYTIKFKTDNIINKIEYWHSKKINMMVKEYVNEIPLSTNTHYSDFASTKIDIITHSGTTEDNQVANPLHGYYQSCGVYGSVIGGNLVTNPLHGYYQSCGVYSNVEKGNHVVNSNTSF